MLFRFTFLGPGTFSYLVILFTPSLLPILFRYGGIRDHVSTLNSISSNDMLIQVYR